MEWILVVKAPPPPYVMVFEVVSRKNMYEFIVARTCEEACAIMDTLKPALFLLDMELRDMPALELYDRLHSKPGLEDVPALLLGPAVCPVMECELARRGITYLGKPVNWETLLESMDKRVLASSHTTQSD
jgi:response regulator RpfG family c-di-GMP phosphodiesterase